MKRIIFIILTCSLAACAILGARCSKKSSPTAPPASSQGSGKAVSMQDNSFSPATIAVTQGDTVVWTNNGSVDHTSTSGSGCTADGNWNSGTMAPGATFRRAFAVAGSYPYYCTFHCSMGMTGTVTVNAK